ncbi:MAG: hypothetical protein RIR39_2700, partial [Pseudomonadota bacterium]
EIGFGVVKSIVIGLLLFIPVGLIQFNRDFVLDADVTVEKNEEQLHHFKVQSRTGLSHTMFSDANQYEPVARKAAFTDLADKIIKALSLTR